LLQGATYDFEHRIVIDGETRWVREKAEIEFDAEGKPRFATGIIQDVTQRKRAEEGLRHSEGKAREQADEVAAILDAVPAMTFIAHDRACQKMTSSRAAYRLLRLPYGANTSKSATEGEWPRNFRIMKDGRELSADELPVQRAAATGEPVRDCELLLKFEDDTSIWIYGHAVPLLDASGSVRGAVGAFVDITGHKRLEELTIRQEVRRNLLEREILAREEERRRLARELHDASGQMLASLLAGLRLIEDSKTVKAVKTQVKTLRALTSRTIDEVGRLARDLHPIVLDDFGLEVALKNYLSEYSRLHGVGTELKFVGFGSERLPRVLEHGLYRIAQEALTNVARHARAKAVTVLLSLVREELTMTISDDGCGFRTEAPEQALKIHLGCQGMRERASMLGGTIKIESQVGSGTCITVKIPTDSVGTQAGPALVMK
jgi:signal transduction histidine kinase